MLESLAPLSAKHASASWLCGIALLLPGIVCAVPEAQAQETTTEIVYHLDEWNLLPVEIAEEFVGFFAWVQPGDPSQSGYIALWLSLFDEAEWDPWVYTGSDLGAAVIEVERMFLNEQILRTNPTFAAAVAATQSAEESELPAQTYVNATNGMFGAGTNRTGFPQNLAGTSSSAMLGFIAQASELEPCETPVPQEGLFLLDMELNELWIDYTGSAQSNWSTMTALACIPCFSSGAWACPAWGAWGAWTFTYSFPHMGGAVSCNYSRSRSRVCTRTVVRFCITYTQRKTETQKEKKTCIEDMPPCPATPSC